MPDGLRAVVVGFVTPFEGLCQLKNAMSDLRADTNTDVLGEFWQGIDHNKTTATSYGLANQCCSRPKYADAHEISELLSRSDILALPTLNHTRSKNSRVEFRFGLQFVVAKVGDLPRRVRSTVDRVVCKPSMLTFDSALQKFEDLTHLRRSKAGVKKPATDKVAK